MCSTHKKQKTKIFIYRKVMERDTVSKKLVTSHLYMHNYQANLGDGLDKLNCGRLVSPPCCETKSNFPFVVCQP